MSRDNVDLAPGELTPHWPVMVDKPEPKHHADHGGERGRRPDTALECDYCGRRVDSCLLAALVVLQLLYLALVCVLLFGR